MVIRVPDQRKTPGGYAALDDRLLVLDFQAGNPQAFVEIHLRYGALARHVCQRFLPQQQDADEAFQETMIRVFQGLYRFNGRYALQPWIARIAKNVSLDHLRGRARRPQADASAPASDELAVPGDEADEIVERLVQRDTVLSVLSDLPETHRRALMLREIEGRSHREVAQEMEISPSQAKALIHRAKGSFRRLWLEKVADRGGLMGFAFLPLLWLAQALNGFRRVADRVGFAAQSAQVAVPDSVTSAVGTTAAPVASSGMGERLVAAGMTLLVAGGVTVGAAKIVNDRNDHPVTSPPVTQIVAVGDASVDESEPQDQSVDRPFLHEKTPDPQDLIKAEPPVVIEPSPSPSPPLEVPVVDPVPDPSPTPEPSPTPSPEPTPPPAPDWDFSFTVVMNAATGCSCDARPTLQSSTLDGKVGGGISFAQVVKGASRDASGRALWPFYLEHSGAVDASGGSLTYSFVLGTPEGPIWYDGSASLVTESPGRAGSATYRFVGDYDLRPDQLALEDVLPEQMPVTGRMVASLSVWQDGTIYLGEFNLLETTA